MFDKHHSPWAWVVDRCWVVGVACAVCDVCAAGLEGKRQDPVHGCRRGLVQNFPLKSKQFHEISTEQYSTFW